VLAVSFKNRNAPSLGHRVSVFLDRLNKPNNCIDALRRNHGTTFDTRLLLPLTIRAFALRTILPLAGLGAVIVLTISASLVAATKGTRWVAALVVATLIVGFAPRIVDATTRHATGGARKEEDRRIEATFLSELAARKQDHRLGPPQR
jgi:hypothetical protein